MRSLVFRNNGSRVHRAIVMGNAARPRGIDSSRSVCMSPPSPPPQPPPRQVHEFPRLCMCACVYGVHCATTVAATTRARVIHTECAHGRTHNASRRGNRVHINICCARTHTFVRRAACERSRRRVAVPCATHTLASVVANGCIQTYILARALKHTHAMAVVMVVVVVVCERAK